MGEADDLAAHLLVVYNNNDRDSKGLAEYYAAQRHIPPDRLYAVSSPLTEEITRSEFDETIRSPIVSYIVQKDWMTRQPARVRVAGRYLDLLVATHNDIWAIVLMRGVPLKIAPDPTDQDAMEDQPELQSNAAAVDSELALLPIFGLPKGGYVPNIFFDNQVAGIKRVGSESAKNLILVTRLDGPTPEDVRRMIDDSINAEKGRLAGLAVIDTRGITDPKNGYISGDQWLRSSRDMLFHDGWDIEYDAKGDVLPATDPCNHIALYLGWYHDGAIGPWVTAPNRFVPGRHRLPPPFLQRDDGTQYERRMGWPAHRPRRRHATMGMVYEPYLALTPHEDIFTRRLLQGDYFAEAAYASERALSWMLTVVGDPLYRPFHQPLDLALMNSASPHTEHDDWLLIQKIQRDLVANRLQLKTDSLTHALDVPGAGAVAEEDLGDLLQRLTETSAGPAIERAYKKALDEVATPVDRIRVGLKLAQYYATHNQGSRAQAELDDLREIYPDDAKRFGVPDQLSPVSAVAKQPR